MNRELNFDSKPGMRMHSPGRKTGIPFDDTTVHKKKKAFTITSEELKKAMELGYHKPEVRL